MVLISARKDPRSVTWGFVRVVTEEFGGEGGQSAGAGPEDVGGVRYGLELDRAVVPGGGGVDHDHRFAGDDPSTARLDTVQTRNTQRLFHEGLQEALSSQPQRGARPSRGNTHAAAHTPETSGCGPLLDETPPTGTG
jgi:hypothetical protein